jgi:hypothetical protein
MPTLTVQRRQTLEERADTPVDVTVDETAILHAAVLEDWVEPRQSWELELQEGHEVGRAHDVEAQMLYVSGEQTSSLRFEERGHIITTT